MVNFNTRVYRATCPNCNYPNIFAEIASTGEKASKLLESRPFFICKSCGQIINKAKPFAMPSIRFNTYDGNTVELQTRIKGPRKFLIAETPTYIKFNVRNLRMSGFIGILKLYGFSDIDSIYILFYEDKIELFTGRNEDREYRNPQSYRVRAEEIETEEEMPDEEA